MSCQSWRFEKNSAAWPVLDHARTAWVQFLDNRSIFKVWQTTTSQSFDLKRLPIPLWKDLNLLNTHRINSREQKDFKDRFYIGPIWAPYLFSVTITANFKV